MKTVGIHTLGCRVNQYESVAIAEELQRHGFAVVKSEEPCDYYIINTCSVTAESQRQSRQTARRFALRGKTAVVGCASQNVKEEFLSIPNVFYVGGCSEKLSVVDAIVCEQRADAVREMANAAYEPMALRGGSDLFSSCRAFVKIQDGCNGRCSYCIIPTLRGPSRIRPIEEILAEAHRLTDAGYHELVLTGIEVSAYPMRELVSLIERLRSLREAGLYRVRFGSVSPSSLKEPFLQALASAENAMPHLHLSLQSGSDRILGLMRRPYTRKQVTEGVRLAYQYLPDVRLSADFITGFPTETEEEYLETESLVRETKLMHVHAFPYSEREGTAASVMDGAVPKEERKRRCQRLNALSEAQKKQQLASLYGREVIVLAEKCRNGLVTGHTEEFIEAVFAYEQATVGALYRVTAIGQQDGKLLCDRAEQII